MIGLRVLARAAAVLTIVVAGVVTVNGPVAHADGVIALAGCNDFRVLSRDRPSTIWQGNEVVDDSLEISIRWCDFKWYTGVVNSRANGKVSCRWTFDLKINGRWAPAPVSPNASNNCGTAGGPAAYSGTYIERVGGFIDCAQGTLSVSYNSYGVIHQPVTFRTTVRYTPVSGGATWCS